MTVLFVTHDIEEATFIGDTVNIMCAKEKKIVKQIRINKGMNTLEAKNIKHFMLNKM